MRLTNRTLTILRIIFVAAALCLLAGLPRFQSQTTSPGLVQVRIHKGQPDKSRSGYTKEETHGNCREVQCFELFGRQI